MILDLNTQAFYALDEVGTAMWSALAETPDINAAFSSLQDQFEVEASRLGEDLDHFIARCQALKFVDDVSADGPSEMGCSANAWRMPARPFILNALFSLVSTHFSLRVFGFRRVYESCSALQQSPTTPRDIAHATSAFVRAENLFISRRAPNDCLLRSLALFRFLRRCGFAAEHVIGVRRVPFAVHAWVEVNGVSQLEVNPVKIGMTALGRIS
ncbi:MAG TPA: lasso peptide biosynthesis B2 protein [Bryobacteraceae bacterium]|nr:lasso peptide biosynthesis B2 protein [Bryobacteraceae bacterium]